MKKMTFVTPAPAKTTGQKVADYAITLILIAFIGYVFQKLFELLLKPFQYLLMKSEDYREIYLEKAVEKKRNRDNRIEQLRTDPSDPMVQYRLRFIECPDKYEGDSTNKKYLEWYKNWLEGRVQDPELRWAPAVYLNKEINPDFVSYVGLQVDICGNKIIGTIRKFYPELTPRFPDILEDIKRLKSMVEEKSLHTELFTELKSMGLSDVLVNELIKMEPDKIQDAARYFQKCSEFGYPDSVSLTLMESGFELGSKEAEGVVKWMTKALLPSYVISAFVKGELEVDDLEAIAKEIGFMNDTFGVMFTYGKDVNGVCPIDELIKDIMNKAGVRIRSNRMEKQIGRKAW
jgi:hypothetical protein